MISITKKSVRVVNFEDAETKNKLSLTVDIGEGLKGINLTLSQYGRKSRMYLPSETVLTIINPTELEKVVNFLIEVLAETGLARIEETD